ncbi:hypothetical protein [Streptomyces sp. NPDC002537]
MSEETGEAGIQARYAAQFADDLERNQKEQEALRARLQQLEKEHAWLLGMRGTVAGERKAAGKAVGDAEDTATAASVPRPRRTRKEAAAPGRRKKPAQAASADAPRAPRGRTRKSDGPTLGELVLGLLAGHHEPRMVGEIVTELGRVHPERSVSAQVVRNTVEALVAKGRLERERKQGSVFYTAPTGEDDTAPLTVAPEPEAAEEQTPAEV